MSKSVVLDTGPLGRIAHPRSNPEIGAWLEALLASGVEVVVPAIASYELRRSFLLAGPARSIAVLDELEAVLRYLPLSDEAIRHAAALWADARKLGIPTADPKELDCDVLLAAQALEVQGIVATENVGHLARYVTAKHWRDLR